MAALPQREARLELAAPGQLVWDRGKKELRPAELELATGNQVFKTLGHGDCRPFAQVCRSMDNRGGR